MDMPANELDSEHADFAYGFSSLRPPRYAAQSAWAHPTVKRGAGCSIRLTAWL
jgi:hypothetical protein